MAHSSRVQRAEREGIRVALGQLLVSLRTGADAEEAEDLQDAVRVRANALERHTYTTPDDKLSVREFEGVVEKLRLSGHSTAADKAEASWAAYVASYEEASSKAQTSFAKSDTLNYSPPTALLKLLLCLARAPSLAGVIGNAGSAQASIAAAVSLPSAAAWASSRAPGQATANAATVSALSSSGSGSGRDEKEDEEDESLQQWRSQLDAEEDEEEEDDDDNVEEEEDDDEDDDEEEGEEDREDKDKDRDRDAHKRNGRINPSFPQQHHQDQPPTIGHYVLNDANDQPIDENDDKNDDENDDDDDEEGSPIPPVPRHSRGLHYGAPLSQHAQAVPIPRPKRAVPVPSSGGAVNYIGAGGAGVGAGRGGVSEGTGPGPKRGGQGRLSMDLAAEELRLAALELGRVTGRVDVEELLDVIFRDFCIGK